MQTALRVVAARADDLGFVLALVPRLAEVRPDWRDEREIVEGTRRHLRSALLEGPREDQFFALTEANGERVGFVWVSTQRDYFGGEPHAHIEELAVEREGLGAGRALMEAAEVWSRGRGYRFVSLNVRPGNDRAKRLYAACGYDLDVEHRIKPLR